MEVILESWDQDIGQEGPVWGLTYILILWCVSDETWRHRYEDLFGGGTWHGLQRDANLVSWMEVTCYMGLGAWFQLGWDLWHTSLDLYGLVMVFELSSDAIWSDRKELIRHMDGGEMQLSGHRLRWHATWTEFRCESMGLGWGGMGCGWRWYLYLHLDGGEMWPACRWSVLVRLEVWHDLDGGETRISAPGWWWSVTWMKVRWQSWDIEGQNVHGWSLYNKLVTCMQLIQDRNGETHIDCCWIGLRWSWYAILGELGVVETLHGLKWDTNITTCIEVRCDLDGSEIWS